MATRIVGNRSLQHGFGLASVMVAIALSTLLAILASIELTRRLHDSAAEATAHYLLAARDALVAFQLRHEAWLQGVDIQAAPPGTYAPPPTLNWVSGAGGVQLMHGTMAVLKQQGLLTAGQPDFTPLGERAQWLLVRQGDCPGSDCNLQSYVYTCHPVSTQPSSRSAVSCLTPDGSRAEYNPALLGQVMLSTQGYAGHDALLEGQFTGPLFNANKAWFPLSNMPGHAVVAATLGVTPFGQFVRMGDTRHVHLQDKLSVAGVVQTDAGLLLNTTVSPGAPCLTPRVFAASAANQLAVCSGGVWSVSSGASVQGVFTNLVDGAHVAPPVCQPPATPFRYVSLSAHDVTVTGGNLDVHGDVGGSVGGSGSVNATGNVSLSGTFSGSFQSAASSTLRVTQSVSINTNHRIEITSAGPNARASVIQGCLS